jgi:hypothetical protein
MGSPAQAPPQLVDVTLAVFGGRKTDIAPSDCPEGITPDEQDGVYLPGDWQSRPCLSKLFATGQLTPGTQVLYEKTYIQPNNDPLTLFLTSDGTLWVEDVGNNPGNPSSLFSIEPGLYAQSVTADGREYIAFSDLLHGQGIPLQYDGTNLDRVTQDGPGAPPNFEADYFTSAAISAIGGYLYTVITTITESDYLATATTASAHGLLPGSYVYIFGASVAGYNGLQTVVGVPSANTFTYTLAATGLANATGGEVGLAIGRAIVTVAPNINPGDSVVISGSNSGLDNGSAGNPAQWQYLETLPYLGGGYEVLFSIATGPPTLVITPTEGGTIQYGGQSAPGVHQAVVIFLTRNGALTQPSPPISFSSVGNSRWQFNDLPIGPSNVVARVLGFTGAGGDNFFIIPASVTLPNPTNPLGTPIVVQSTIVEDNSSTSAIFDVPDNTLLAGIAIDQIGNDLFDQRVLGPVLGFFSYASRLMCWGDYAKVENLLNMGFCGGYLAGALTTPLGWTIVGGSTGGVLVNGFVNIDTTTTSAVVATGAGSVSALSYQGMTVGTEVTIDSGANQETVAITGFTLIGVHQIIVAFNAVFTKLHAAGVPVTGEALGGGVGPWAAGMCWQITGDGSNNRKGQISQPCYQDAYGDAILLPGTQYGLRMWINNVGGAATGQVSVELSSASTGFLAYAQILCSELPAGGQFVTVEFLTDIGGNPVPTPSVIPADMTLILYDYQTANGQIVLHSELELIYEQNPYNNVLVRVSYPENPEGFAQTTGNLGAADDDSAVQCLALLQESALLETLDGVHLFQDNDNEPGASPGGWQVNQKTRAVGALSLRSGDPGKFGTGDAAEDWAVIASKNGVYLFAGGEFWKVSQEISRGALPQAQDPRPTWDDINWAAQQTIVAKNDPSSRRAYFAVPINGAPTPNIVFVLDYREMDTASQIASAPPVHITIQGKMKSSDLTRKWSVWNISANDLEILVRPGNQRLLFFAGGLRNGNAYGNAYSLDPTKLTDDDYGQMFPYYTTYAFTDHDQEQGLGLGSDIHLYKHIHAFIPGVGQVTITPIVDSLYNFQPPLSPRLLTSDLNQGTFLKSDLEWSGMMTRGHRVFFRIAVQPLPGATDVQIRVQKFIVGMMKDALMQFRQSGV